MAMCLAELPKLKNLAIRFHSTIFHPDPIHLLPVTRAVLPALTNFEFTGAREYLEDLVARINCPQLNIIVISYLINIVHFQVVEFQIVELFKFFDRLAGTEISLFKHVKVRFDMTNKTCWDFLLARIIISCQGINWGFSRIPEVLSKFSVILSSVIDLKIEGWFLAGYYFPIGHEWPQLLHQFLTVQALYVS
jgi:hypothetical protein